MPLLVKYCTIIIITFQDTQKSKEYLDILNGKTAALTGLSLFVLSQLGVTGWLAHVVAIMGN
jgi:hypothetical protein